MKFEISQLSMVQNFNFNTIKVGSEHYSHDLIHASISLYKEGWTLRKNSRKAFKTKVTFDEALLFLQTEINLITSNNLYKAPFIQGFIREVRPIDYTSSIVQLKKLNSCDK